MDRQHNQNSSMEDEAKTDQCNDKPQTGIASSAAVNASKAENNPDKYFQRFKELFKGWKHADYIQGGILIVGAIYCVVTFLMWCAMKDANTIAQQNLRSDQRSWVGLEGTITVDGLELVPRLMVASHYSVRNFGHGPAVKVFASGFFWEDAKTLPGLAATICSGPYGVATGTSPRTPETPNPGPIGFTLFPDQVHEYTIGSPTDPWEGDAQPNLQHFWFVGCVAYVDQFKLPHWTRFCMEPDIFSRHPINKDVPLTFCAQYNDTSDTEPQKQ